MLFRIHLFLLFFLIACSTLHGQTPGRFQKEVDSIVTLHKSFRKDNLILFTGSSSIRMWKDLESSFPSHNVINMGFGGSEMADLAYYADQLIVRFKPSQIFIYEGDNDLSAGRTPEQIIAATESVLSTIRKTLPDVEVVFISPKPSLARWELREKYEVFNTRLWKWTSGKKNVRYVDVWTPMLNEQGTVRNDIFIADGLHLNEKGYAIWTTTIREYLRPPGR